VALGLTAGFTTAVSQTADAASGNLSTLRAQAAALASRINTLGNQEEQLAEKYDSSVIALKRDKANVAAAKARVAKADGQAGAAATALRSEAVSAYIDSGTSSATSSSSVGSANSGLLRAEYEQTMAGRQADAEDQYKLASEVEATAESNLQAKERAQTKTNAAILADKASINHTVTQLQSAEATDKGRIKTLVAQYREEAIRRAAAAEQRRLAAERAAAARAAAARAAAETTTTTVAPATTADPPPTHSSGSTSPATSPRQAPPPTTPVTTAPPATTPPPTVGVGGGGGGGGSAAQIAVNAAVGEVGVPYVWGGASPSGFDCSGLVMWAYAHAGVSLPHSSELQYADTTHISMGDLQPGDLVYPGGLYHVAMYIGGGKIVQAPYTGADVQVIPLSSFFTLASRPA